MLGELLIKEPSVLITERHRAWLPGEAFPEQLDQAEALFCGQAKNHSDFGMAHDRKAITGARA